MTEETPYYDQLRKELAGSMISKARKLNKEKCIVELKPCVYEILPIEGYNSRTYTVLYDYDFKECNCQHYVKNGGPCSHIAAVALYLKNAKARAEETTLGFKISSGGYDDNQ